MTASLVITPEIGVPYASSERYIDLRERAEAACNTAQDLQSLGMSFDTTEEDIELARDLLKEFAADPESASKRVQDTYVAPTGKKSLDQPRPSSLILIDTLLGEFGQLVVQNSAHIRNLVTNKLLLETNSNDPRVRLRALELLGKISDVGLFTEKRELTVTHRSTDDIRATLKEKLKRLNQDTAEAEYTEYEVIDDDGS